MNSAVFNVRKHVFIQQYTIHTAFQKTNRNKSCLIKGEGAGWPVLISLLLTEHKAGIIKF